ncbi:MAG TPA: hypothetical protein VFJ18_12865, partial [Pararhizobium sp.]|nr:hypothetical protein [Pararhizobium sp.]
KAFVSQQSQGTPAPDRLGIHLPAALSADAITHLLLPAGDSAPRGLVGAKPWSVGHGLYLAIVCTGGEPFDEKYTLTH